MFHQLNLPLASFFEYDFFFCSCQIHIYIPFYFRCDILNESLTFTSFYRLSYKRIFSFVLFCFCDYCASICLLFVEWIYTYNSSIVMKILFRLRIMYLINWKENLDDRIFWNESYCREKMMYSWYFVLFFELYRCE
jgi:hypothetical protein